LPENYNSNDGSWLMVHGSRLMEIEAGSKEYLRTDGYEYDRRITEYRA
jgi:hypothetical protein